MPLESLDIAVDFSDYDHTCTHADYLSYHSDHIYVFIYVYIYTWYVYVHIYVYI
jgi:hypothetical protein